MKDLPDIYQGVSLLQKIATTSLQGRVEATVLVVDDDEAVCRILERMLSDEHYQVKLSHSVAEALEIIEENAFDVYLIDYHLTDGIGFHVAEHIRAKGQETPIILLSGSEPNFGDPRAQELSIFDVIPKPFSRAMISNALKKAIASPKGIAA